MKTLKSLVFMLAVTAALAIGATAQTAFNTINGTRLDLADSKGKVIILSVGASWLPLSAKQAEFTNVLAKRYTGKDVVVYFIATDSLDSRSKNFASNDDILKFASTNKLTVPVLRDPDGAIILKLYEVDQLPSFVILDKQGRRSGEPFGGIDPKADVTLPISKAVDKLL